MYLQVLSTLQQRYLAQTTRYASFGPLVSVFFKLSVVFLNTDYNCYSFSNDPNDGYTVVWAPEPHHLNASHTLTVCHLTSRYNYATMTISGPNDAIQYASFGPLVSVFFFNYLLFFILTSIYHRVSNVPKWQDQQQGSRPKRLEPCHCHFTPNPPPENTHQARTMVIQPSFGPNKCFLYLYL